MEYIPGVTLREYLLSQRNKKLSLKESLPILRQIADALDFAHGEKIIHRDIKPNNIMVMPRGKVQVIDFGLAAQVRTSMTQVSKVRMDKSGTPHYKAPEQWRGKYQDAKTDQYALGVLAYELLAGKLPFDGLDEMEIGFQVINEPVPFISNQPQNVNVAIAKAMAKNREERFSSCREFVETLSSPNKPTVPDELEFEFPPQKKKSGCTSCITQAVYLGCLGMLGFLGVIVLLMIIGGLAG
jgi:serine/threonine-protein kinase